MNSYSFSSSFMVSLGICQKDYTHPVFIELSSVSVFIKVGYWIENLYHKIFSLPSLPFGLDVM